MKNQKNVLISRLRNCNNKREAKAFIAYVVYNNIKINKLGENVFYSNNPALGNKIVAVNVSTNDLTGGFLAKKIQTDYDLNFGFSSEMFEGYLEKMLHFKNEFIFPEDEFKWILEDDIACYWVWLVLKDRDGCYLDVAKYGCDINTFATLKMVFDLLNLDAYPSGKTSRYEIIRDVFDSWFAMNDVKVKLIHQIKSMWNAIQKESKGLTWIKKEIPDQINFLWEYMLAYESMSKLHALNLSPSTHKEKLLAIRAFYYYWVTESDIKTLFSIRSNKAWSQRKHIISNKEKDLKAINVFINKKSKNKMDSILKQKKMSMGELIELMVDREFKILTEK
ncbi:hypothetical protein [Rahnella aquatilis]|uniref:hypothetical protein n=1 Tax=Rahnella aquatilis TaxID=34038 RepID=UPI00064678F5|nr:hypothetical protein [Rahnella aquatilis]